jgi:hypothetical protein
VGYQKGQRAIAITHRALVDLLEEVAGYPELRKKVSAAMKTNATAYLIVADLRRKGISKGLLQQHQPMAAALKAGQFTCEVVGEQLVKLSDAALLNTVVNSAQQENVLREALKAAKNASRGPPRVGNQGGNRAGGHASPNNRNKNARPSNGQQQGNSSRQSSFLGDSRNKPYRPREQSNNRENRDNRNSQPSTSRRNDRRSN